MPDRIAPSDEFTTGRVFVITIPCISADFAADLEWIGIDQEVQQLD